MKRLIIGMTAAMALALTPQSPISIVAMVSAATLYRGSHPDRVRWGLNAVIIGGVLTELVVRILERYYAKSTFTPIPVVVLQPAARGKEEAS